jgi:conserved oligomeric Golgi complex subunit 2
VLRRDVLREFVKKVLSYISLPHAMLIWLNPSIAFETIFPGALQIPHPPFVPQTPVPIREKFSFPDTLRTPYAPFTAFSTQTDPFNAALSAAPRLDETDNPLAVLYNGILAFLDRDLKRILDIAERLSARIGREGDGAVDARGFEVLANVIWAEIARALMDELGSALFAAGRPDEFRKVRRSLQIFSLY